MASVAKSIFDRELLELRLSSALAAAFENWSHLAIDAVLSNATPDVRDEFLRAAVISAVPDQVQDQAGAYFDDYQVLGDVVDVLTEVRQIAANQGLGEDATRALMRSAVRIDRGVFVPTPSTVLTQTRVSTPVLVPAQGLPRTPHLPEHLTLLDDAVPLAEVGNTYRTRLERTGRTMSTALSGQLARIEAEVLGKDLRWVTMGDHRVRSSHRAAQGQTVTHDEWFHVGGIPMEFPGDPAAPDDETINCRCVLTLVDPPERRYVQNYIPREWLAAAGAPDQVRAPKGTPIGGQWIDTPLSIMDKIVMESKGIPIPEEGPYPRPQDMADEYARRLEEAWGDPNLEVTVNGMSGGDTYGTKFMAVITDKDGNRVGDFERTFYADGHVSHDQFRLDPEYQGRGMGSKMQAASEDFYRELGYDRIELKAGLDVGGYTWAKQGYEFDGQLTAYDVAYYAWDSIGRMPGVSPTARQQANDIFARAQAEAAASGDQDNSYFPTGILPAEIAMIGWTPGATMWPGKEALMGYEWYGVKHLNPSSVTAADVASVSDRAAAVAAIHRGWVPTAQYVSEPVPYLAESWYPATEEDVHTLPASDAEYWTLVMQVLTPTVKVPQDALSAAVSAETAPPVSTYAVGSAPPQARAPEGTPIGGQWIDTPSALLHDLGWTGESADTAERVYYPPSLPDEPPEWLNNESVYQGLNKGMGGGYRAERAIQEYSGSGSIALNKWMRGQEMTDQDKHRVPDPAGLMRDMMTGADPLPMHAVTYRGVGDSLGKDPSQFIGKVIRDDAFVSTSTDPYTAKQYGRATDPYLRIISPKGHPAIWADPVSINRGERELILPPRTALAITKVDTDSDGRAMVTAHVVEEADTFSANPSLMAGARPVVSTATPEPLFDIDDGEGERQRWETHAEHDARTSTASTNPSLTAAAPAQVRAPKGTPIGGQWIDTPSTLREGLGIGVGVRMTLTRGWADPEVLANARSVAEQKEARLPEPTEADRKAAAARHGRSKRAGGDDRPGSKRRKQLRQKLLDEFGDGTTCPCLNCGRVLDITTVSMDRIIPGADNGRYVPDNLIPMDYDCNRARSDDDFDDMAAAWADSPGRSTWATNPSLPVKAVVPPGTRVRARVSGWGVDESDDLGGADDAPSLEGAPEWVDGPLEGQAVPGYFKHIVADYDVDPASVEEEP